MCCNRTLLPGFAGAFRDSELVALDIADLEETKACRSTKAPDGPQAYVRDADLCRDHANQGRFSRDIFPSRSDALYGPMNR
jgi:hypothetical protein